MTINALDIAIFQEYLYGIVEPQYLRPIDWPALTTDSRKFRLAYIKSSHGAAVPGIHADAYPVESWIRNRDGARKVGILPAPYHYWYWKLSGIRLDPVAQAEAFHTTVKDDPGDLPPQMDIEDTSVFPDVEPVTWTTTEANRCLANAVAVLKSLEILLDATSNKFKRLAVPYCGKWWWDRLVGQVRYYKPSALDFARTYGWYAADYSGTLADVPEWREILHQYTSTAVPPVAGISVLGGSRVDLVRWVGTDEEYAVWSGQPPAIEPTKDEKFDLMWADYLARH